MSFALYMIGLVLVVGGIAWGMVTAGVPDIYVAIVSVIVFGAGVMSAVSRTRSKDPSN
jgi:flagellar motor component MotA